ncbi:MAG: methyltransferase [Pseudomonadota bacterium]
MTEGGAQPTGILGGRVTLLQPPRSVYRSGSDAVLLASVLPAGFSGAAVDLGAGTGAVGFCVAARCTGATVLCVDSDEGAITLASAALALEANQGFAGRVATGLGDIEAVPEAWNPPVAPVDAVLFNPPYVRPGHGRISPDEQRQRARTLGEDGLLPWFGAVRRLLKPGGLFGAIAPPAFLGEMLQEGFGGASIYPIQSRSSEPAKRIVVTAFEGRKAGPQIMPALVMHGAGKAFTPVAQSLLRGDICLGEACSIR